MKVYYLLILIYFYFLSNNVFPGLLAQTSQNKDEKLQQIWEAGIPPITHYTLEDYKAAGQNWCFIQDDNGIMYIGNGAGILEFDGVTWRLIKLPNESRVISVAKRNDGTIFLGGSRDFGYLVKDSIGRTQFRSLLPQLDTNYQDFSDVFSTYAFEDTIYFITEKYLFRWVNNSFKVLFPKGIFGFCFLIKDRLYVNDRGAGLKQLIGDTLKLIPDGTIFKKGGITAMSEYEKNKILMIHIRQGAFLYDHKKIVPFKNKLIKNKSTYGSIVLPDGGLLIYSIGAGAYVVDHDGKIKQRFNKKRGLTSDVIYNAFVDKDRGLWLASDNGINRVDISSPFRLFNSLNGLTRGAENALVTLQGLYVSTTDGLFHFLKNNLSFMRIKGINNMSRDLIPVNDRIISGNLNALYWIDSKDQAHEIKFGGDSYNILLKSVIDTNNIYVAGNSGNVYTLSQSGKDWQLSDPILNVDGKIMQLIEYPDTTLWINTYNNGLFKLHKYFSKTDRSSKKEYEAIHFGLHEGIPSIRYNFLCKTDDKLYLSTQSGLYFFDSAAQKFIPDMTLMNQINLKNMGGVPMAFSEKGLWMSVNSNFQNRIYLAKNDVLSEIKKAREFSNLQIENIYSPGKDIVFFAGTSMLTYNSKRDQTVKPTFPIQIRKVLLKNDSLIFAGQIDHKKEEAIELAFKNSPIRFSYALPGYDKPQANQYQYYLEGYDNKWSRWSNETQRDFTNLSEGDYVFHVRGKNVYGQISKEDQFAFTILPPWQRTWWAYLLYIFTGLSIVGLIVQWRSKHLKREKEELENVVKERTRQLAKQAEQLKEMDQQKSRFFANISHEFRTPLTLIKGPVENVLQSPKKSLSVEDEIMIRNNADRLLRLVNQLLDLSKLDAKNIELNPVNGDIFEFLRAAGSAFSSHAEQRNIDYHVLVPNDKLITSFDHDKLEKIIYNLLSNAFKFTPDKGEIILNAFFNNEELTIEVSDTGIGISPEQLPFIFDRFYQTDDSFTRKQEGAGIGLSLTKELITLMQGNIKAESQPGEGSKFIIKLPAPLPTSPQMGEESEKCELITIHPILQEVISPKEEDNSKAPSLREGVGDGLSIILIVEDNHDMRNFIKKQLQSDHRILESSHGKDGLQIAKKEIPDLIITDLMMPQMDGMTLCKKLKTNEYTNHIPVIMLTAKAGQEHKIEGLETGADSYLTKPFDRKELQVRVNNLIQQRKQLREKFSREITLQPRNINITSIEEQFLKKVENIIEKNLDNDQFGITQIQNALAMSRTQLYRKMKALTDQAPSEFLRNYRLKRAAQILSQQGENVTQAAYAVGFSNLSYFAKCFKELFGVAPSEYINTTHQ